MHMQVQASWVLDHIKRNLCSITNYTSTHWYEMVVMVTFDIWLAKPSMNKDAHVSFSVSSFAVWMLRTI